MDPFIQAIIPYGYASKAKARDAFTSISETQFNWKPSSAQWSVAECLEHLYISDRLYFQTLQEVAEGTYQMSFWERISPFSSFFGKALVGQLKEEVGRKMTTNRKLEPSASNKPLSFIPVYLDNLETFLSHISSCEGLDLSKIIMTSPVLSFVTYSVKNAIQFLIQHEHRHLNQAIRVTRDPRFPKK